MNLLKNRNIVVVGVANRRSLAFGIAKALDAAGARLVLTYQAERLRPWVEKLGAGLQQPPLLVQCDVTQEEEIDGMFAVVDQELDGLGGLVHSVAFAKGDELAGNYIDTSWEGYRLAQQISAWSLIRLAKGAAPRMTEGGAMLAMTYLGSGRVVPNYNVMGVAKASLEASVRYLAADLGPQNIRVNALSAGPVKTLSAMGIEGFTRMLDSYAQVAPLRRCVTQEDVGNTGLFLLSELASAITGQVVFVDAGYSILGATPSPPPC